MSDPDPARPPDGNGTASNQNGSHAEKPTFSQRVWRVIVGRPRDLQDRSLFHRLSLIPFLAWVGLGADGLSSSSYGPEEAFKTLGDQHSYIAVAVAFGMIVTVLIISAAYSRIIEQFPHGGGGYVVATKLLGERAGVISGSALLVDYMLTITVSVAAAGEAIFSLLPGLQAWKLPFEGVAIVGLTALNIRGVRESVIVLTPIFILFLITHLILILGTLILHATDLPAVARDVGEGFSKGYETLGLGGLGLIAIHAYSMGGGTYTGIEAVSNGLQIMREPRVQTARRTMVYMAISLAFTAAGLLLCYLLMKVPAALPEGKTMNAVLAERFVQEVPLGEVFVILTLVSEGALLIVAAQAGFLDGPRVLANMAHDSWVPRSFGALSDRLTTQNGIVLMGAASMVALLYTEGDVQHLVVMYSINVFLTFSLSMFAMLRHWILVRAKEPIWKRRVALFGVGFVMCATILVMTVLEKFVAGGWITLVVTGGFVVLCFLIRRHYRTTVRALAKLDEVLGELPTHEDPPPPLDPKAATAGVMVARYGGLGVHTILSIFRSFPGQFKNLVFISVGVIDSGQFKGSEEIEALRESTENEMKKYVDLARRLGFPATYRVAIGTDAVDEARELCLKVRDEFPRTVVFAGKLVFQQETWYHRLLHNQTATAVQKSLQWQGMTMVILPVGVK